eukprot:TRINITY_DN15050_c0_g1_i1.p1 TRINITY_DN15050_c0_g1~~TRINITY_DN15050_c0_g1_i1.p1  ORF type:complete len:627 (+),score=104.57 TRINITY_DN15050_c0_g1_i1:101-1981(+)
MSTLAWTGEAGAGGESQARVPVSRTLAGSGGAGDGRAHVHLTGTPEAHVATAQELLCEDVEPTDDAPPADNSAPRHGAAAAPAAPVVHPGNPLAPSMCSNPSGPRTKSIPRSEATSAEMHRVSTTGMTDLSVHIREGFRSSHASSPTGVASSGTSDAGCLSASLARSQCPPAADAKGARGAWCTSSSPPSSPRVASSASTPAPAELVLGRPSASGSVTDLFTNVGTWSTVTGSKSGSSFTEPSNGLQRWFFHSDVPLWLKLVVAVAPTALLSLALFITLCVAVADSPLLLVLSLGIFVLALILSGGILGQLLHAINVQDAVLVVEIRNRTAMQERVASFIPAEFLSMLNVQEVTEIVAGDRAEQTITVMFTNIRDFGNRVRGSDSVEVFDRLARIAGTLAPIIRDHGGFVDKHLGDGIMAIFRITEWSVVAAVAMQHAIGQLVIDESGSPLEMGIGLHHGGVCVGTLGDAKRLDTTVVSFVVNLASRFEGLTKYYGAGIMVSKEVLREADTRGILLRCLGDVRVKGSSQVHRMYDVFEADPSNKRSLKIETMESFEAGLVRYSRLEWPEALALWRVCLATARDRYGSTDASPLDRAVATKIYFARAYAKSGPPFADWAGVDVWDSK